MKFFKLYVKIIFVSLICQYNLPIMKELLYLKDEQLKDLIEKLFVSYRETFSDAKKVLDRHSIGLAHHKVIHLLVDVPRYLNFRAFKTPKSN